jgi:hypothetical protein
VREGGASSTSHLTPGVYSLYWYTSTNTDAVDCIGTQFTRFTGIQVQILTHARRLHRISRQVLTGWVVASSSSARLRLKHRIDALSQRLGRLSLDCMRQTLVSALRSWADVTERCKVSKETKQLACEKSSREQRNISRGLLSRVFWAWYVSARA